MAQDNRINLVLDQLQISSSAKVLILNSQDPQLLQSHGHVEHQQFFKPMHQRLDAAGVTLVDAPNGPYDFVIVSTTKSKLESLGLIGLGYTQLNVGGTLIINGDKTNGIEGRFKDLRKISPVSPAISKAHGKVFWVEKSEGNSAIGDWIDHLSLLENDAGFAVTHGCFSPAQVDQGSAMLAETLPQLTGMVADFGAGWGYLAVTALANNPDISTLHLYEAYAPALSCAQHNISDARAQLHWTDVTALTGEAFDTILMNPPFHQGKRTDISLGQAFIKSSARNLAKHGQLYLVANRQLAYETTLNACFGQVETLTQAQGFKLIKATKPKA